MFVSLVLKWFIFSLCLTESCVMAEKSRSVWEHARVCASVWERARAWESVWECALVNFLFLVCSASQLLHSVFDMMLPSGCLNKPLSSLVIVVVSWFWRFTLQNAVFFFARSCFSWWGHQHDGGDVCAHAGYVSLDTSLGSVTVHLLFINLLRMMQDASKIRLLVYICHTLNSL